jgi:HK97 family phage major capsid protein
MPDVHDLERQLHTSLDRQKELLDATVDEGREFTDEEKTEYDGLTVTTESLSGKIEKLQAIEDRAAQFTHAGRQTSPDNSRGDVRVEVLAENIAKDPRGGFGENGIGHFAAAIYDAAHGKEMTPQLRNWAAGTGVQQAVGSEGGFLVPPEFSTMIWDGMNTGADALLPRTDQYTIEGESMTFNANAETSRATGSRYGGVRGYWIAELDQLTSSQPKWRQVKVEPKEMGVFVYASDKMLRNASTTLPQYLTRCASEEIDFMTGDAIINGDGVGKPLGILNSDARETIAAEVPQTAATIVQQNISKMWTSLHSRARANAVWFINQEIEPQLDVLSVDVGTGGVPVYMPPGGLADAPYGRLKGRPVIPIEYCAALGTEGDIILTDLGAYVTGVKGSIRSDVSMHLKFDYVQSAFRFLWELDGQPWLASGITPYKGSITLSPYVTLATRS